MPYELENLNLRTQRTRRNIVKMGAILVPATLGTVHSAAALEVCLPIVGCFSIGGDGDGKGGKGGKGGNCFLKGNRLRTAEGERRIEDLAIGDLLPTAFGGLRPIQWIGRIVIRKSDLSKPWVKEALPVRIARSALGPNAPHADLIVTALHGVLIDGVLVPAEALLNGATITRYEPEGDEMEFFHIKLESHDVIYAEGARSRRCFMSTSPSSILPITCAATERRLRKGAAARRSFRSGGREELKSRLRSALSPWVDFRDQADVVRDRLEECGIA